MTPPANDYSVMLVVANMWPRYVVWADAFSPAVTGGNDRSSSARGSGAAVENNGFSRTCNLPSIDQRRSDSVQRPRLTGGVLACAAPRVSKREAGEATHGEHGRPAARGLREAGRRGAPGALA